MSEPLDLEDLIYSHLAQFSNDMQDLQDNVARLEGDSNGTTASIRCIVKRLNKQLSTINSRLDKIERKL